MIVTELYNGQGLGNQLFSYVMTRTLALDKGVPFGIMHPERFKGASFLHLDFGEPVIGGTIPYEGGAPTSLPKGILHAYCEKLILHPSGADIRTYDNDLLKIEDNTKIDGIFQGENYFKHRKHEIRKWLHVNIPSLPENLCIINFRGGEYVGLDAVFLRPKYWHDAIGHMCSIRNDMTFRVVTDDVQTAQQFFPEFEISHDLANDYVSIQGASYLILSNSSFAFFPAWLNENAKYVIAPKYWARHNVSDGYWSCGYALVEGWNYMDREGVLYDYAEAFREHTSYWENHKRLFTYVTSQHSYTKPPAPHPLLAKITNTVSRVKKRIYAIFKKSISASNQHTAIPKCELEIFRRLADDIHVVFDIGARDDIDLYTIHPKAIYHLFEPNPSFFKSLQRKVESLATKNIVLHPIGISDVAQDTSTYFEKSQSFILNPTLSSDTLSTFTCATKRLDETIAELNIPHIDFLKIDTEGLDYTILSSSKDIIRERVSYIQFEYWDGVRKFVDLLGNDFDLYLMMEPQLAHCINENKGVSTETIDTTQSVLPLDDNLITYIDSTLIPLGCGGNILGISKSHPTIDGKKLLFTV